MFICSDIAIGAPYEHDRGAVYIYLGGKDGLDYHPVTKYWQRISPSDFPSLPFSLRGFGISISTGSLVQKGYPGTHFFLNFPIQLKTYVCQHG